MPFCKKIYHFSRGVYILGQKYACSYRECRKEFVILYCGKCNMTYIKQADLNANILYTCENCKNIMPTIQCAKCYKFCCLTNDTKIETQSIFICPYESCGQKSYYYKCPYCNHDFNLDKYTCTNIKCPFQNCNKVYTYFRCHKCLKDNFIENIDNNNNMECDELNCSFCNENNEIINQTNKVINVKKAYITQGEKFVFDNPEEDPYDKLIINSLIQTKIYEIPYGEKNNNINSGEGEHNTKCVICLDNEKKWILAPCGHKCLCAQCGKNETAIREKYQKCPICKETIIGALDKIIDD